MEDRDAVLLDWSYADNLYLVRKDGSTPIERISIVLPLVVGGILLGNALLGNGTLAHAGTLHRAILEAIGVVLIGFSMYQLMRISRKYKRGI